MFKVASHFPVKMGFWSFCVCFVASKLQRLLKMLSLQIFWPFCMCALERLPVGVGRGGKKINQSLSKIRRWRASALLGPKGNPNPTGVFDNLSRNYYRETFCCWEQASVSGRSWRVSKEFVCPLIITVNRVCAFLLRFTTLLTEARGGPRANQEPLATSTLRHVFPLLCHAPGKRWKASGGLFFHGECYIFSFFSPKYYKTLSDFIYLFIGRKARHFRVLFFLSSCNWVFFTHFLIDGISKCEYVPL